MKKTLVTLLGLVVAGTVFGQGTILFNNRVAGVFDARVYGQVAGNPTLQIQGQPSTGVPAGTTDYQGAPLLSGAGYTAQLFAGPSGASVNPLAPTDGLTGLTTLPFRTGTGAGIFNTPAPTVTVPGVPENSSARAQVRVWDNQGGTVTSWAMVLARQDTVAHGWSTDFLTPGLGGTLTPTPNLLGLTAFNLFVVPEPSIIALGALGLGALILFRRRK